MKRVEIDVQKAIEQIMEKKLTRNAAAEKLGINTSTLNYKIYEYLKTLSPKKLKEVKNVLSKIGKNNKTSIRTNTSHPNYNYNVKKMLLYISKDKISKREAKDLALKLKIEIPCVKIYEQLKKSGVTVF